ncbi:hypothetical protein [Flavobacterium jumunjinense]|uniref:hypothetical protein n=1 Tax=Flavobacterium jumunjinense TaxID=998845 RepID=UPI001F47B74C
MTKLLWAETYLGHYSDNDDTMYKGVGGFVECFDIKEEISQKSYEMGYYEIEKLSNIRGKDSTYEKLIHNDYLKNDKLFSEFWYNYENSLEIKKVIFNTIWVYFLCEVTFEKHYLGLIEQYVPILDSPSKLSYRKIQIPTYLIKIISIKPNIKE